MIYDDEQDTRPVREKLEERVLQAIDTAIAVAGASEIGKTHQLLCAQHALALCDLYERISGRKVTYLF